MAYDSFSSTLFNGDGFDGTITSDFLRLGIVSEAAKKDLIDFSIDGFDEYKTAMLNYVKAVYPNDYSNFVESDLGMMFIELYAYLGSVLSLKADFLANESFLPTVKTRENLRKMLQLIGLDLRGPISSKATGTLTMRAQTKASLGSLRVPRASRTFSIPNAKDGGSLFYSVYKVLPTGKVDTTSNGLEDLVFTSADVTENSITGLLLLEGKLTLSTGTFSDRQQQKRITLPEASIAEGSIVVSGSDGTIYNEIDNLFLASGSTHAVFEKQYDADFGCTLTFGEGTRGKAPQANSNYEVMYRVGGGSRGDIPTNHINVNLKATVGANSFSPTLVNTTQGTGGRNAETVSHAKKYAPNFFRAQHRAVTGDDYTSLSNSFVSQAGATGKAMAALRQNGSSANMIDLYVLNKASDVQLERCSLTYKNELLNHMNRYRMFTDEITVVDGLVRTLDLVATLFIDRKNEQVEESIKQKVANKIISFFNVDNMHYGKALSLSDLVNTVLTVPEVRFFQVNNLDNDVYINFNEIIQLNNFELNVDII